MCLCLGIQQVEFYERLANLLPTMDTLRAVLNRPSMLEMDLNASVSMVEQRSAQFGSKHPFTSSRQMCPIKFKRVSQQLQAGGLTVSSDPVSAQRE